MCQLQLRQRQFQCQLLYAPPENPDTNPPLGADLGIVDSGNGVTENVNFDDLTSDILGMKALFAGLSDADYTAPPY